MDSLNSLYRSHIATIRRVWDSELAGCGYDAAVIFAGAPQPILFDDKYYPFKINPHFQHWVPLLQPSHSALVLQQGQKPCLWFYDPLDHWEASENVIEDYWASEIEIVRFDDKAKLKELTLALPQKTAWIGERPGFSLPDQWQVNPKDLVHAIHYARAVKTPYEKNNLRGATRRAVLGHKAAENAFRNGCSEFEIHMAYLAACQHTENELPYQSIVCLNENAACLHYRNKNTQRMNASDLKSFLIDAGATYKGYISDVTRSYAKEPGIFSDLIDALDRLQQSIIDFARPGVDYVNLNHKTHIGIAHILREMALVDMEAEEMVDTGITATFFPHGLGHFIGVQVHDVGGHMASPTGDLRPPPAMYPFLRLTRILEDGHAVTIEPGIYFITDLLQKLRTNPVGQFVDWRKIEMLLPFGGIRIEDNILIAVSGAENMTRDAFAA